MSEAPPDFKALARRYLDLWQDQVAAVATDPALAEAVARGVAMMTQSAAAVAQATGLKCGATAPVGGKPEADERKTPSSTDGQPQAGAQTPAAASDDARLNHDELARRIGALEERIAVLEAALGGSGGKAAAKPRRKRP
ncbi:conserved hypothetical protein [Candidatus Terasakiella magnetica]|nr:conserved hypothetical protein [Candidatus Terasakiella magnetica]